MSVTQGSAWVRCVPVRALVVVAAGLVAGGLAVPAGAAASRATPGIMGLHAANRLAWDVRSSGAFAGSPSNSALFGPIGEWGPGTEVPASGGYGYFTAVSCADASDCTAVGQDSANQAPIYETESHGVWGALTEVTPPGGVGGSPFEGLYGVSCVSTGDCTAIGVDGNSEPMYLTESRGVWATPTEIPSTSGAVFFDGVSCAGARDCTAVGSEFGSGDNLVPFYVSESHGVWGAATAIPTTGDQEEANASSVSCVDASDCTAVGVDGNGEPFYTTESDGVWAAPIEIPAAAGDDSWWYANLFGEFGLGGFYGVSCVHAGDCTAVGQDGNGFPFYATESDAVWGAPTEISGAGDVDGLYGVSCWHAGDCTAVGQDDNSEPFAETESNGVWGAPTEITAPGTSGGPGGYGYEYEGFEGVSCVDASDCTAVGLDTNLEPFYATESPLTVSSISPRSGPITGNTAITIRGTGFVPGATVEIGQGQGAAGVTIEGSDVDVVSPTEITAVTGGPARPGLWNAYVVEPGATSRANLHDFYLYLG